MKRLIPALFLATPAFALTPELLTFLSSDDTSYVSGTTADGDVFVAPEAAPGDLYLLLPDCTARHATHGTGTWGYANGGWLIEFPDRRIGFPRQEPPPVVGEDCTLK